VELAGIEPASSGADPGLLRAQSAWRFSRPQCSRRRVTDGLSRCECPDQIPRPGLISEPSRWGQLLGRRRSQTDPSRYRL